MTSIFHHSDAEEPKKNESMTKIALLVSVTVCLIIFTITITFIFLRWAICIFLRESLKDKQLFPRWWDLEN